jgi:hypothetical protein
MDFLSNNDNHLRLARELSSRTFLAMATLTRKAENRFTYAALSTIVDICLCDVTVP